MTELSIRMPDVGEGVTAVELTEWYVKVGDLVREDDPIAAVLTDKATVEIPSLYSGRVVAVGGEIGEMLAVGAELARIESDLDVMAPAPAAEPAKAPDPKPAEKVAEAPTPETPAAKPAATAPKSAARSDGPVRALRAEGSAPLASPSVRARARKAGIDLRMVAGTGPAGRITESDLDAVFAAPQGGTASASRQRNGTEQIRVIGLRRKIAERMALANAHIPHITVVEEIDATEVEALRARMNDGRGDKPKLTMLPLLTAALSRALVDHPEMNAWYDDEAGVITRHNPVHIGIATMTDGGLMVPVLRHAEALRPFATATEIARLADAARNGTATRDELTGSTITISSLGPLGAVVTTPIINPPEVAILGINKMAVRPMWDGESFVPRKMMNISASFDHRVIDGWNAASFIQRLKTLLESPALIFIEAE